MIEEIEEGCKCPECHEGSMEIPRSKNCSCHISPPCSSCTDRLLTCDSCGWEYEPEVEPIPPPTQAERDGWERYQADWEAARQRGHTLPSGGRIFDIHIDGSSGSTMVFTGRFEGEVNHKEIFEHLGDGTFGHRGPFIYESQKRFSYTKITD